MFYIFPHVHRMHMTLLWAFSSHWDWALIVSHSTNEPKQHPTMLFGLQVCFFLLYFFITYFCHLSSVAYVATTIHWPPTLQNHIRNIKWAQTTSNDVVWATSMFFFLYFFFYLFIPFSISLVAPLHQGSFIYYSWLVN